MLGLILRMIVDLIKMLIVGHYILGMKLVRGKSTYTLSFLFFIIILFYLILQYPSEYAIYLETTALMTVFTFLFSGRKIKNFHLQSSSKS